MNARTPSWVCDCLWFLAWAVGSSVWCLTAASQLGATADEPPYVIYGLERWRTGSYERFMGMGTMPLAADVQTLPLYLRERQKGKPINPLERWDRVLGRARAATLLFWWVLLGYGWLAGRRLAGPWGGRLAVALLACEPNLLAHAGLATTDLALSATLLALVYHFRTGRGARWWRRVLLPSLWFAGALLAKASALVFGPVCLFVVGLEHALGQRFRRLPVADNDTEAAPALPPAPQSTPRSVSRSLPWDVLQIVGLGFLLALLYCGSDWRASTSLAPWIDRMPQGTARSALAWFAGLPIFSNAAEGILWQVFQNANQTPAYLLGKVYQDGCWYYFLVGLSIKLNEAVLALLAGLLVLRPRVLLNWALLAAVALLALSPTFRVYNGVRLLLPLIALAMVGLAAAAVRAWQQSNPGWRRSLLARAPAVALAWMAWSAVHVWPDGICYTSALWGGTKTGYLRLTGADYDWGQGLKQLNRWHRRHGRPPLCVWVFGNDPGFLKMSASALSLGDRTIRGGEQVLALVRGRYLAVSVLWLHGFIDTAASRFLNARQPVARAGTYFIYDFTREGKTRVPDLPPGSSARP
jgi:hypothetical protein